jgi:hypothetical protein
MNNVRDWNARYATFMLAVYEYMSFLDNYTFRIVKQRCCKSKDAFGLTKLIDWNYYSFFFFFFLNALDSIKLKQQL